MHSAPSPFGSALRSQRRDTGATLADMARLARVTKATLSRIERGLQLPSDDLLTRIAAAYGLQLDVLYLLLGRIPPRLLEPIAARPAQALSFITAGARTDFKST